MIGRWLFRWRGVIGFGAYCVVFGLGRPDVRSCLVGLPLVVMGLGLRFWAMGYLGQAVRARELVTEGLVQDGPYRWLSHPLYTGNFLLVLGMVITLRPDWLVAIAVLAGFLVEYGLIAAAERSWLAAQRLPVVPRRFSGKRARAEWPTWVVTGVAYGLGWVKAVWLGRLAR